MKSKKWITQWVFVLLLPAFGWGQNYVKGYYVNYYLDTIVGYIADEEPNMYNYRFLFTKKPDLSEGIRTIDPSSVKAFGGEKMGNYEGKLLYSAKFEKNIWIFARRLVGGHTNLFLANDRLWIQKNAKSDLMPLLATRLHRASGQLDTLAELTNLHRQNQPKWEDATHRYEALYIRTLEKALGAFATDRLDSLDLNVKTITDLVLDYNTVRYNGKNKKTIITGERKLKGLVMGLSVINPTDYATKSVVITHSTPVTWGGQMGYSFKNGVELGINYYDYLIDMKQTVVYFKGSIAEAIPWDLHLKIVNYGISGRYVLLPKHSFSPYFSVGIQRINISLLRYKREPARDPLMEPYVEIPAPGTKYGVYNSLILANFGGGLRTWFSSHHGVQAGLDYSIAHPIRRSHWNASYLYRF